EGMLTTSTDKGYLALAGYDAAVGTGNVGNTASAATNRVIGRVDTNGVVNTTTALTDAASAASPRGAVTTNGMDLWVTGGAGGVRYATLGATTSTQLSTTITNLRGALISGGQLYTSNSSGGNVRVGAVGVGTPTTSGQTITGLPGVPTSGSPNQFFLADLSAG